jgi:hypothetical protein
LDLLALAAGHRLGGAAVMQVKAMMAMTPVAFVMGRDRADLTAALALDRFRRHATGRKLGFVGGTGAEHDASMARRRLRSPDAGSQDFVSLASGRAGIFYRIWQAGNLPR